MNQRLPLLREKTSKLTSSPGVYIMKNKDSAIIYIGKAKNLKNRVTSYFRENPDHTPKVAAMVSNVFDYDFIVTDSEYEALLLECSLIKQHKPKYNILLKDDKGYHYIRISDEQFPRITAEKNTLSGGTFLGPYTSGFITKETVNEVNKVFKLPTCHKKFPQDFHKSRPCLNYSIKQCMGLCRGKISCGTYNDIISQAVDYIKNGSSDSTERMEAQMLEASDKLDFERAALLRDRINAIRKSAEKQKIMNCSFSCADVIASAEDSSGICISVLMYRESRLFDKAAFFFPIPDKDDDPLSSFMQQFYHGKTDIPTAIILETLPSETELISTMLKAQCGRKIELRVAQRGQFSELIRLAKNNSSEYLAINSGRTAKEVLELEELAKALGLAKPPQYIEAYDISNLSSSSMVAGMVVFENGRPNKKAYKHFNIKEFSSQDDYGCMHEVLKRRLSRIGSDDSDQFFARCPDLILLDGGKGHVNAVAPLLSEYNLDIPLFGMVKDGKHRTRAISTGDKEIQLTSIHSAFMLLTRIQDEVHRFSVSFMHSKHKQSTYLSEFTSVKGIGTKKAAKLMSVFKTKDNLKKASPSDIKSALSINDSTLSELLQIISDMK